MSNNSQRQNIDIFTNHSELKQEAHLFTLDEIAVGSSCVIVECNLPATLRNRLEEMGLTKGATVTVLKFAPLGDPMEITVRGYSLCIRAETAKAFVVMNMEL